MVRLRQFLRSVLPADLTQLIFLLGVVCLLVSAHSRWNMGTGASRSGSYEMVPAYISLFGLLILFAGLAGYYFCLWSVKRPVIKIICLVALPTVASLVGASFFFHPGAGSQSVLLTDASDSNMWRWITSNVGSFATGPQLCFAGLLLCLLFLSRLAFGLTTLPLALPAGAPLGEDTSLWRNCKVLIFFLIGPTFFLGTLLYMPALLLPHSFFSSLITFEMYGALITLLSGTVFALMPILFFRKNGWNLVKRAIILPEPLYTFFSLLVPVIVTVAISVGQFLAARAMWAHQLVQTTPPVFDTYLNLKGLHAFSILEFGPAAFAEEIVFRGILLALLTKRYGLQRGVFFVGMIWAASHFLSDSYTGMAIGAAAVSVVLRILICLAMNYVLAWMTMRWNSVIPSGFAHAVSNILILADINPPDSTNPFWRIACWSALAYILWRYWPITEYDVAFEEVKPVKIPLANPEPAG